jgi:hypothetical protein
MPVSMPLGTVRLMKRWGIAIQMIKVSHHGKKWTHACHAAHRAIHLVEREVNTVKTDGLELLCSQEYRIDGQ